MANDFTVDNCSDRRLLRFRIRIRVLCGEVVESGCVFLGGIGVHDEKLGAGGVGALAAGHRKDSPGVF
jgi:hypothetical protein